MAKLIMILAPGYEETEAVVTIDLLRRADIEIDVIGLESRMVFGSHNIIYTTDNLLIYTNVKDYDGVIFPGGPGAEKLAASDFISGVVKHMSQNNKLIAAICAAPALVLAPQGVLDNKVATCFDGMENNFNSSTQYKPDNVVVDGNIITSKSVATAFEFGLAIIEYIKDKQSADKVAKDIKLI